MNMRDLMCLCAMLAAGTASAAIDQFDGGTISGDGSLVLVKLDSTGARTQGLTVDLGFHYSDFATLSSGHVGSLSGPNNVVVWDFAQNTITKNGATLSGITNDWASSFATFAANADLEETRWAVISGSHKGVTPVGFLTTGTPSSAQRSAQGAPLTTGMVLVNAGLIRQPSLAGAGTLNTSDNGAYVMGSGGVGYSGTAYGLTSSNGWAVNGTSPAVAWDTWNVDGASTNLWQVKPNGLENAVADFDLLYGGLGISLTSGPTGLLNNKGTFTLKGNTLTWSTTPVPEPQSYGLALLGLWLAGMVARRSHGSNKA